MSVSSSYAQRQRAERNRSLLHDYSAQFGRIADRFAAEAALRLGKEQAEQAARVASDAKDKAEAANRAKSDFLANMRSRACGLRSTPSSASPTSSRSRCWVRSRTSATLEYIRDINNSANPLRRSINDILDLSEDRIRQRAADRGERRPRCDPSPRASRSSASAPAMAA
jgi:signal transduction histidine kinase